MPPGVFQFESQGMRDVLKQMRPDRFEDLIAAVALYRPGPMANIPAYCQRKHGEKWEPPHPELADILGETYGIMVYQEQVMQIAQKMAGYSLGSADLLRRAMGKKIRAEMESQRQLFTDGAVARGIEPAKAAEVFDLMAKFADYGFNKSHARRLRAGRLADGLDEGQPSGRLHRRLHEPGRRQHRQAGRAAPGGVAHGHRRAAAGHQPFRRGFRRGTHRRGQARHSLRPRRGEEGRRGGDAGDRADARQFRFCRFR